MELVRLLLAARGAVVSAFRHGLLRWSRRPAVPEGWSDPAGKHSVGVLDAAIAGIGSEPTHGVIRVWYPAVPGTGRSPRAYFGDTAEQETMARGLRSLLSARGASALGARLTASRPDAAIAVEGAPVVIFSHGFTGFVGQNTHLCEELASAGYIVVSIAYPGAAAAIAAPDGTATVMTAADRRRLLSAEFIGTMLALLRSRSAADEDAALAKTATIDSLDRENARWTRHLTAVLDALVPEGERASRVGERTARVLDAADWSRLALVGMSFGGSTSANVAHADSRVAAAVNLDGMQQGESLRLRDARVPVLVMSSAGSLLRSGRTVTDLHYAAPGSRARVRRVLVPEAGHYAFTDLVEFGTGRVRRLLDLGTVDPSRMLALVAGTTLEFLDSVLRPSLAVGASEGRTGEGRR